MAAIKRLNTSYTLTTINSSDSVTLNTSLVTITGNLTVLGTQAAINTANTTLYDNIITLNAGLAPNTAPTLNAGIEVDRGSAANVSLRWNETTKTWQVTDQFGTYANIASTNGFFLANISQDTAPALGGNLDTKNNQIYNSLGSVVTFSDNVAIITTGVTPSAIASTTVVYASTPSGGGSGLYTTTLSTGSNELATKSAAIKYSIIFG